MIKKVLYFLLILSLIIFELNAAQKPSYDIDGEWIPREGLRNYTRFSSPTDLEYVKHYEVKGYNALKKMDFSEAKKYYGEIYDKSPSLFVMYTILKLQPFYPMFLYDVIKIAVDYKREDFIRYIVDSWRQVEEPIVLPSPVVLPSEDTFYPTPLLSAVAITGITGIYYYRERISSGLSSSHTDFKERGWVKK